MHVVVKKVQRMQPAVKIIHGRFRSTTSWSMAGQSGNITTASCHRYAMKLWESCKTNKKREARQVWSVKQAFILLSYFQHRHGSWGMMSPCMPCFTLLA